MFKKRFVYLSWHTTFVDGLIYYFLSYRYYDYAFRVLFWKQFSQVWHETQVKLNHLSKHGKAKKMLTNDGMDQSHLVTHGNHLWNYGQTEGKETSHPEQAQTNTRLKEVQYCIITMQWVLVEILQKLLHPTVSSIIPETVKRARAAGGSQLAPRSSRRTA